MLLMAFLVFLGVVAVVAIAAVGRPLAEVYAEKLKFQYRELGSAAEQQLKSRLESVELEVLSLKEQLSGLKFENEFLLRRLADAGIDMSDPEGQRAAPSPTEPGVILKLESEEKQR